MSLQIIQLNPDRPLLNGWKIVLEPQHELYIFPSQVRNNTIDFTKNDVPIGYRIVAFDTGEVGKWNMISNSISISFPACIVELGKDFHSTAKTFKLPLSISSGWVYKIPFATTKPGEIEHSLQILISGSIRRHPHFDITEGYRLWDLETGKSSNWNVVGVGMSTQFHEVPFKSGLQIVESSKRAPGIEAWPELQS